MTEMDLPSDVLVICTRNRIDDFKRCLASVEAANHIPNRILVVDSSDGLETENYCAQSDLPINYIRALGGLTAKRNIALAEALEEIVHFIDDDVEVEPDYFRALDEVLRDSPHTAGAGGAIVGSRPGKPSLISRLGLNSSLSPGRVLRSGFNTQCFAAPKATNVDWLSGCSMSFRMSVICGLKFDERRKGYALGEDVDFGLKALQRGPLLYTPSARLVHHESPINRPDLPARIRASVHTRWALAVDFPHRVSRGLVIYSSVIEGLRIGVRSVKPGRSLQRRMAFAVFEGIVDVLKDGANVDL